LPLNLSFRNIFSIVNNFYIPVDARANLNDPLDSSVCIVEMAAFSISFLRWKAPALLNKHYQVLLEIFVEKAIK